MIPSASQTVGPFFNFALTTDPALGILAREGAAGERIRLTLRIVDGDGEPASADAMIELWQADSQGRFPHPLDPGAAQVDPHFRHFGRLETGANGACTFTTVRPGAVDHQAPHISVAIFARGLLKQLHTRVYFAGDPRNATDRVLALVPEERRATMMAQPSQDAWFLEIRLQGEGETVFFDM